MHRNSFHRKNCARNSLQQDKTKIYELVKKSEIEKIKIEHQYGFTAAGYFTYLLLIGTCLVLTFLNLWERWNQLIDPKSSNGFDQQEFQQLIYPAITICNVQPNIKIVHNKCQSYEDEINCKFIDRSFEFGQHSLFHNTNIKQTLCHTYNNDLENPRISHNIDLKDLLIISVKINIDDYPKDAIIKGVSVSLHAQEKNPGGFYGGIIAHPGNMFLIRLKKVVNEYLNNTSVETYDAKISTIGDLNFEKTWGPKNDTVVLVFTYQDLSVMIIRELSPYSISNFFSETGGVFFFFIGSSIIHAFIFLLQWLWGTRLNEINFVSVQNIQDSELTKKEDNSYIDPKKMPNNEKEKEKKENMLDSDLTRIPTEDEAEYFLDRFSIL